MTQPLDTLELAEEELCQESTPQSPLSTPENDESSCNTAAPQSNCLLHRPLVSKTYCIPPIRESPTNSTQRNAFS